ncbi:MAG: response regulator [Gemmatimonadota bacterium]|nr:response regulator [Gemmatimonadota bacterium]
MHRILVVDDESHVATLLGAQLRLLGYEGVVADGAEHALELLEADPERYSAVLTDFDMPGMTGSELAEAVSERSLGVPVILVTGHDADIPEARVPGVSGVLLKPFRRTELAAFLERVIGE